jgi:hypothetical protein
VLGTISITVTIFVVKSSFNFLDNRLPACPDFKEIISKPIKAA